MLISACGRPTLSPKAPIILCGIFLQTTPNLYSTSFAISAWTKLKSRNAGAARSLVVSAMQRFKSTVWKVLSSRNIASYFPKESSVPRRPTHLHFPSGSPAACKAATRWRWLMPLWFCLRLASAPGETCKKATRPILEYTHDPCWPATTRIQKRCGDQGTTSMCGDCSSRCGSSNRFPSHKHARRLSGQSSKHFADTMWCAPKNEIRKCQPHDH